MWARPAAHIQPSHAGCPLAAAAAISGMGSAILGPRTLSRTHCQVLPGLPMSASAWVLSCVFCAPCDRIPWLQSESYRIRIRPALRSDSTPGPLQQCWETSAAEAARPARCRPPSRRPPRPRRARRRVCAPLRAVFFRPFPSVRFPDALAGRRGWFEGQNWTGRLRAALLRAPWRPSRMHKSPGQVVHGMHPPYQAGVGSVVSTHGASSSTANHWMGWQHAHLTA